MNETTTTTALNEGTTEPTTGLDDCRAYIADKLQACNPGDVELKVCVHEDAIETRTDPLGSDHSFTYQPSSLWLVFNDELSLPVMDAPGSERGMVADPTDYLSEAKPVSDDFYYHLYETVTRVENEPDLPIDHVRVDNQTGYLWERYHLQELLVRAFTNHYDSNLFIDLILDVARHRYEDTTSEPAEEQNTESEITGSFGGLRTDIPPEVTENALITTTTETEPLAAIDRLMDVIYDAAGEPITLATPYVSTAVGRALFHAAEQGSDITVIADSQTRNQLNTENYQEHENITISINKTPIPTTIFHVPKSALIMGFDESNNPTSILEAFDPIAIDWVRDYIADIQQPIQPSTPTTNRHPAQN